MSRFAKYIVLSAVCVLLVGGLSAAQSQSRVFALIVAKVELGHMAEYTAIIEKEIVPLLKKNDVELVGVFNSGVGGASNELTMLLGYRDYAHVQQTFQDPEVQKIQKEKFQTIRVLNTKMLIPTAFSPLK